jgi:hypothetical protein
MEITTGELMADCGEGRGEERKKRGTYGGGVILGSG